MVIFGCCSRLYLRRKCNHDKIAHGQFSYIASRMQAEWTLIPLIYIKPPQRERSRLPKVLFCQACVKSTCEAKRTNRITPNQEGGSTMFRYAFVGLTAIVL